MISRFVFLSAAVAAAILPSCSNEDVAGTEPSQENTISFSAVTPRPSRGAATTTATMKNFVVYAFTESTKIMDGVTVTRDGGSWTYSPAAYWPSTPVNFYAYSPDITNSTDIKGDTGGHIPDYLNNGQTDLLYSVNMNVGQQAAPVLMNFRHAMAKVNMMLSSKNERLKIKVSHISLCNIYLQGTFNFPDATTAADTPDIQGSWTDLKKQSDLLTFYAMGEGDEVTLTSTPTDYTENNLDVCFILPQTLNDVSLSGNEYKGSYLQVDCEIFDAASGVKVWPTGKTPSYLLVQESNCGRLVFPAKSGNVGEWQMGHAYVYNISIDNPDVLDQIDFDVPVDDYVIDQM